MSFDVVIRGGTVYDGTGPGGRVADVGVKDGRIAAIGALEPNGLEIDAAGLAVAPGFIDIHSHSDYTLLMDPRAVSAIHQGVTTEVVGNCGFGCFPIRDPQQARRAIYGYSDDLPISWSSAGEYFETLEACRPAVNVLSLVPNGQLRLATLGLADRPADAGELGRDAGAAARVPRRGRLGLLDRARVRAGAGGERGGADRAGAEGAASMRRTRASATRARPTRWPRRSAPARTQRCGSRSRISCPRNGIEESRRCIELVDAARDGGQDVAFDMHTRTFGLTNLYAVLPAWALGADAGRARGDPARPAKRDEMRGHPRILSAGNDWSRVVLLDSEGWPEYAAATSPRSPPTATRIRSTPPTICCSAVSTSCRS